MVIAKQKLGTFVRMVKFDLSLSSNSSNILMDYLGYQSDKLWINMVIVVENRIIVKILEERERQSLRTIWVL